MRLQPPVAQKGNYFVTVQFMKNWRDWPARAKAAKILSGLSDADLCEVITDRSGRKAGRAQVNHWFTGKREPTITQFIMLCEELGADPGNILFGVPVLPNTVHKEVADAITADPTKNHNYKMQEKRLKLRKNRRTEKTS